MKEKESSTFKSFIVGLFALFVGQSQFAIGVFLNELQEDGVDTSKVFTT
ncbi:hypothetical protein [Leptospira noguchii]|nr:hypothetical protein [Leptospira noguchii]UOG50908.1 hypothetical protein MAL00_19295 [Leptospira noguchii]